MEIRFSANEIEIFLKVLEEAEGSVSQTVSAYLSQINTFYFF